MNVTYREARSAANAASALSNKVLLTLDSILRVSALVYALKPAMTQLESATTTLRLEYVTKDENGRDQILDEAKFLAAFNELLDKHVEVKEVFITPADVPKTLKNEEKDQENQLGIAAIFAELGPFFKRD